MVPTLHVTHWACSFKEVVMHVVIRQYQLEPATIEPITEQTRAKVKHYYSKILPGFIEYCLIDAGNGHLIALNIFADKVVAEASTRVAAGYVRDHLSTSIHTPQQVSDGEVIVSVVGQEGQPKGSS